MANIHLARSQSLNFGRPYSIPFHFVDCPTPPPSTVSGSDDPIIRRRDTDDIFHAIKYRLVRVLAKVNDCLALPDLPHYDVAFQLDKDLRATEAAVPPALRWQEAQKRIPLLQVPEQDMVVAQRHMTHLLLHKALLGPFTPSCQTTCTDRKQRYIVHGSGKHFAPARNRF